jgi:hypothetical protein
MTREQGSSPPVRQLRLVIETEDYERGGTLIAEPRETPWRSLNSRPTGPDGLQITLLRELDAPAQPGDPGPS